MPATNPTPEQLRHEAYQLVRSLTSDFDGLSGIVSPSYAIEPVDLLPIVGKVQRLRELVQLLALAERDAG